MRQAQETHGKQLNEVLRVVAHTIAFNRMIDHVAADEVRHAHGAAASGRRSHVPCSARLPQVESEMLDVTYMACRDDGIRGSIEEAIACFSASMTRVDPHTCRGVLKLHLYNVQVNKKYFMWAVEEKLMWEEWAVPVTVIDSASVVQDGERHVRRSQWCPPSRFRRPSFSRAFAMAARAAKSMAELTATVERTMAKIAQMVTQRTAHVPPLQSGPRWLKLEVSSQLARGGRVLPRSCPRACPPVCSWQSQRHGSSRSNGCESCWLHQRRCARRAPWLGRSGMGVTRTCHTRMSCCTLAPALRPLYIPTANQSSGTGQSFSQPLQCLAARALRQSALDQPPAPAPAPAHCACACALRTCTTSSAAATDACCTRSVAPSKCTPCSVVAATCSVPSCSTSCQPMLRTHRGGGGGGGAVPC